MSKQASKQASKKQAEAHPSGAQRSENAAAEAKQKITV